MPRAVPRERDPLVWVKTRIRMSHANPRDKMHVLRAFKNFFGRRSPGLEESIAIKAYIIAYLKSVEVERLLLESDVLSPKGIKAAKEYARWERLLKLLRLQAHLKRPKSRRCKRVAESALDELRMRDGTQG